MASMGQFQGENHCWLKRTQRLVSDMSHKKTHLDNSQDFGENIIWSDKTKAERTLEILNSITSDVKLVSI